jgi:hypothetical protein
MQDLKTGSIIGLNHGFYDQVIDIFDFTSNSAVLGFQLQEGALLVGSAAGIDNVSIKAVPEPSTMLLLGFGLLGVAGAGRKKFFKK